MLVSPQFLIGCTRGLPEGQGHFRVLSLTIMSYRTTLLEMLNFLGGESVDDISADESIIDNLRRKSLSPTTIKRGWPTSRASSTGQPPGMDLMGLNSQG